MTSWAERTWFITGASKGFGRVMTETILGRGGRVVATARDPGALADLVAGSDGRAIAVRLDVADKREIGEAVRAAEAFGGIDVLFNNAGYGFLGGVEESSDDEIDAQWQVNYFGALNMIRALLPGMRERGRGGYIVNISSIAGVRGFQGATFYCATKFALEALSEGLAGEVAPFGIKVMVVEPGYFRTDFSGGSIRMTASPNPAYPELEIHRQAAAAADGNQQGDPVRGVAAIIRAMDNPQPPLHLPLGTDAYKVVNGVLKAKLAELEQWREITESTDFPAN